jgi:sugar phosphate permease
MRIWVVSLLTVMACLLYLDRFAVGIAAESMRADLKMSQTQMSWFLSAFFWAYALSQVPAGWLSDRFGPRMMLTIYIVGWSLFTGLLGVTTYVALLILLRILCGATQAGAYPVASGLIRVWIPITGRGMASSIVAMGVRVGGVLAPVLTAYLMAVFAGRWQTVLILYGMIGILVALAVDWICRDRPLAHPWCNDAERRLIAGDHAILNKNLTREPDEKTRDSEFPWLPVLSSVSLWGNSLTQLLTNVGWVFVVTWLPRYLGDVHDVPLQGQALMTAVPTSAGIVGMLCGGKWTDVAARQFGLKWGRRLPVAATRFMAACGYGFCLIVGLLSTPDPSTRWLPWTIVLGLSIATFNCDLGVPAIWAYAQDVGGKYTASIMGWANMFGNFGAAIAPLLYNLVLGESPTQWQWNCLFMLCGGAFALSVVTALVLDATKPITSEIQRP